MRLRGAALALLAVIVRHGVVDPDSCVVPLISSATDEDESITNDAHAQLLVLIEKLGAQRVETRAVEGAIFSYRFQKAAFGFAAVRSDPVGSRPPQPLLGRFYLECLGFGSTNPLPRRLAFLRTLLSRVVPDTIEGGGNAAAATDSGVVAFGTADASAPVLQHQQRRKSRAAELALQGIVDSRGISAVQSVDLGLSKYLVYTLAFLPYSKEEEVLSLLHGINRLLALHADELLGLLAPFLPSMLEETSGGIRGDDDDDAVVEPTISPPASSIPARGSRAYALLCAHAGFAWALVSLSQVRADMLGLSLQCFRG